MHPLWKDASRQLWRAIVTHEKALLKIKEVFPICLYKFAAFLALFAFSLLTLTFTDTTEPISSFSELFPEKDTYFNLFKRLLLQQTDDTVHAYIN